MAPGEESSGSFWWVAGVSGAMVCCAGFPLLVGAGIAVGAVGLAIGSVLIAAAGAGLALWAWRRHRTARSCEPSAVQPREVRERPPERTGTGEP